MDWTIYALTNPDKQCVRYVGFTSGSLTERLRRHVSDSTRDDPRVSANFKAAWIRALLRAGRKPGIVALQRGTGRGYRKAERFWIALFRASGVDLVNGKTGPKPKQERILG